MLGRALLLALAWLVVPAVSAIADDLTKAPCQQLADYLRRYAKAHPDVTDTGQLELLDAAHLTDKTSDPAAPVSTTASASADSIAGALQLISNVHLDEADLSFFEDKGFVDTLIFARDELGP
jgi:hypothetical protein